MLHDERNHRAKVLLLAGFLGSGKTTLLRRILSWDVDLSGTVVIVNEFGKVGIDGALVEKTGLEVFELASGCICCTIKTDLKRTLKEVWQNFKPKWILIEATGLAEPASVASVVQDEELSRCMSIHKVITVLDMRFWVRREALGSFFFKQLEQADLILLNKVDLFETSQVSQSLRDIHEAILGCRVVPTLYCEVDPDTLWTVDSRNLSGIEVAKYFPTTHAHYQHQEADHDTYHRDGSHEPNRAPLHEGGHGFVDFSFVEDMPLDEESFNHFLAQLPWELFRLKGPVRFADRTVLLNFVAGRSEWEFWNGPAETRLAFVGWKVDGAEIIQKLRRCMLSA